MEDPKSTAQAANATEISPQTSEQKPGKTTPACSEQKPASTSSAAPKKAAPKIPDGYKVVKVNRDGKIVKVLRPIEKDAATKAPAKQGEQPSTAKPITQPAKDQPTPPVKQLPANATTGKPVTVTLTTSNKAEIPVKKSEVAPTKPTVSPPAHASKLETVGKSARLFRRFHRVERHVSHLINAFDPYSDLGDLENRGDYESGDISMPDDSDNDNDNDNDSDSEKSDREQNQQRNTKSVSRAVAKDAAANIGRQPANGKVAPSTKTTQAGISAHNSAGKKSASTELTKDSIVHEKEVLPGTSIEDGEAHPTGPRTLRQHYAAVKWETLAVWSLIILFPLAFMGLGIATSTLDYQSTTTLHSYIDADYEYASYYTETYKSYVLRHATKAAITAWPIVFAAILAQTLKAFATYRVERGIRLLTLEQLISSHSVSSAIKQPFVLRSINWMSFGLLALWALAPLGSQAIQYTTTQVKNIQYENSTIYYLNTAQENPGLSSTYQAQFNYSDSMDVLYAAVFQQSTQFQPAGCDPWGNALIAVVEYLSTSEAAHIDPLTTPWASYYGIPLANLSSYTGDYDETWNFTITASYLNLDCPFLHFETENTLNSLGVNLTTMYNTTEGSLNMNMTPPTANEMVGNLTFVSSCSEVVTNNTETYAYAVCNLTQTFVDANVSCANTNCTVQSIRKKPTTAPTQMTNWINEFLKASDVGQLEYTDIVNSGFSITELYLQNPTNATEPGSGDHCDLSHLTAHDFEQSLAFLLNSFYSTGFTHDFQVGSVSVNDKIWISNNTLDTAQSYYLTAPAVAIRQYQDPYAPMQWRINWAFMFIYLFCCLVLLLIGLVGILLELKTISPDILGFASSLARNSKYIKVDKNKVTGTMGGGERARALGDTLVMMQDIKDSEPVGKIVLGTVNEGTVRLRPGRLYR